MSRVRAPSPALRKLSGCEAGSETQYRSTARRIARVAQLVEHTLGKGEVTGSIPVASSERITEAAGGQGCLRGLPAVQPFLVSSIRYGQGKVRAHEAARERRHHRARRPWEDDADRGDHDHPGRQGAGPAGRV